MVKKTRAAPAKKKPRATVKKKAEKAEATAPAPEKHPIRTLRTEVDRLFENFEKGLGWWPGGHRLLDIEPFFEAFRRVEPGGFGKHPTADLVETDEEYRISAELPGMDDKDVEVTLSEGVLTIKGEKEEEKEEKQKDYHLSERRYGMFRRSFGLPHSVDSDKVQATMKNGVLSVTLQKLPKAEKAAKKVDIKKG
jgi:HSP20 family protein